MGSKLRLIACIALSSILWVSLFTGCLPSRQKTDKSRQSAAADKQQAKEDKSEYKSEFKGASMTWDDEKGRPAWKAQFKKAIASHAGGRTQIELRGVRAVLYESGKVVSKLDAPRVVADSRKREIKATGGVTVVSVEDKTSAYSEQLVWKSREDKIIGTGAVKMVKGNISIMARSFIADAALKRAKFFDAETSMD